MDGILAVLKKGDIKRWIGVAAAVLIGVLGVAAYWYGIVSIFSMLTFVLAAVLLLQLVARMKKLRFGKVELLLLDDCDCDKYISVYKALRDRMPEKGQLDTISIAKGYFFKGDFERAKKELDSVNLETLKGTAWVAYYNVALQVYLEMGELQHAKEIRQEIEKYGARQKKGSPAAKLARQLEKFADFAESFRRRDYETARALQDEILRSSSHAAQLSLQYYRRAVMELAAGQMDEAKEHLEYVEQYGGQIFVRPLAVKLLEEQFGGDVLLETSGEPQE